MSLFDKETKDHHLLSLQGHIQPTSDFVLSRNPNLPNLILNMPNVRHSDIGQPMLYDQIRYPKKTRLHLGRKLIEFAVNGLIQGMYCPHDISRI